MACPICKKKNKLYSINVKDFEYSITNKATYSQCKFCKTIYRTKPTKLNIKKGNLYSKKNYLPLKGNLIYDFLKKIYANFEKDKIIHIAEKDFFDKKIKVLDIACGKGYLIKKFSKLANLCCYGIDLNINSSKNNNLTFTKSNFNNLKLIKKIKPDLIIINNFIEHIENLSYIKKIINKMRKGSYLIIITPDADSSAREKFLNYWSGYHSPRHKCIFTSKSLEKLISKSKKIYINKTKFYDPFSNFISLTNLLKQISFRFSLNHLLNFFKFLPYIFIDIKNKNRIMFSVKKI